MRYVEPDIEWVEIELKLLDEMGRKWFLNNPPKIWRYPSVLEDFALIGMKRAFKNHGFRVTAYATILNRFIRDLYFKDFKIVAHHRQICPQEMKIYKSIGYQFLRFDKKNWRGEIDRLIGEIQKYESKSVVW